VPLITRGLPVTKGEQDERNRRIDQFWASPRGYMACLAVLPTAPYPGRRRCAVLSAVGHLAVVWWAESCSLLGVLAAGL
jgi:hypothetical protein